MSAHEQRRNSASARPARPTRITIERRPSARHRSTSAEPAAVPAPAVQPPAPPLQPHFDYPDQNMRPPRSQPPTSEPFRQQPRTPHSVDWVPRAAREPSPAPVHTFPPAEDRRMRHYPPLLPDPEPSEYYDRPPVHSLPANPNEFSSRPEPVYQYMPAPPVVHLEPVRPPSPHILPPPPIPVFHDNIPSHSYYQPIYPAVPPPMSPLAPIPPVIQIDVAAGAGKYDPDLPQFVNPYESNHPRPHGHGSEKPKTFDDITLADDEEEEDEDWRRLLEPKIPLPRPPVVHLPPERQRRTCWEMLKHFLGTIFAYLKSLIFLIESSTPSRIFYSAFLLGLPSLYFSRVAKIFVGANRSLKKLRKFAVKTLSKEKIEELLTERDRQGVKLELPPIYVALEKDWEGFVDSLVAEWATLNTVSALILPAILTILQIEDASKDYITRYIAIFSLICALMSLVFGCSYIVRFGQMKRPHKAAEWALEAQQSTTGVWWNVWVMLALPAIWLAWSLVLFTTCIMAYLWRSKIVEEGGEPIVRLPTRQQLLALRVILSGFVGLGVVFALAAGGTLRRYGSSMDRDWERRINEWFFGTPVSKPAYYQPLPTRPDERHVPRRHGGTAHPPPQHDDASLDSDEKSRSLAVRQGHYDGNGYTFFGGSERTGQDGSRTASQHGYEAGSSVDDGGSGDGLRRITSGDSGGDLAVVPIRRPTVPGDSRRLRKQHRPNDSV